MEGGSRPPSARPKTSAGRAASAKARHPPQIPDASQRPPSRAPPSRMGGAPPSRMGPIAPPSRMGAPMSRMGERPPSGLIRPPSASMGAPPTGLARPPTASIRPVTQQGLSGGRAVSRLGTGSQRQVFDKSYFIGVLRAKMGQLRAEMGRLEEVYAQGEKDRREISAYEKMAKESAQELRSLQSKLVEMNIVIDKMHTNSDMSQIELDARRLKETADDQDRLTQELYTERKHKEEEVAMLEGEIGEQKRINEETVANMEPGTKERFEQLKDEAEQLKTEVGLMSGELAALEDKKAQLELELEQSALKRKAVEMHETLASLGRKQAELTAEMAAADTPEQRKQKLQETMRKNTDDIATMEKQLQITVEQTELCADELHNFENDDSQYIKNSERYRELAVKDREIKEFLDNYENEMSLLVMDTEEYSSAVVQTLQKISANLEKVSIESRVNDLDPALLHGAAMDENASPKDLQDLHVRLQEEMISVDELETKLHSEIETLERRIVELKEQSEQFADLDQLSREAEQELHGLEAKREELNEEVPSLESEQDSLEGKADSLQRRLDDDPNYASQKSLMRKLEMLNESNESTRKLVESREAETNYSSLKQKVAELREQYNAMLLAAARR